MIPQSAFYPQLRSLQPLLARLESWTPFPCCSIRFRLWCYTCGMPQAAPATSLTAHHRFQKHLHSAWPGFLARRAERLRGLESGHEGEAVTKHIIEDLFTHVLGFSQADLVQQSPGPSSTPRPCLIITRLGLNSMVLQALPPHTLSGFGASVRAVLSQSHRCVSAQVILALGVCDGFLLYAEEQAHGGRRPRVFVTLDSPTPPPDLFWLSTDGVWRRRDDLPQGWDPLASHIHHRPFDPEPEILLDPTHHLPFTCFAYVGDASKPRTWHLPYLHANGSIDNAGLLRAIQAVVSGSHDQGLSSSLVPPASVPVVLLRLAHAANASHQWPLHAASAPAYRLLDQALRQFSLVSPATS